MPKTAQRTYSPYAEHFEHLKDVAAATFAGLIGLYAVFHLTSPPEEPTMSVDCKANPHDFDTLMFPAGDFSKDLLIEAGGERRTLTISRDDGIIRADGLIFARNSIGDPLMYFYDGSELVSGRPATTLDINLGNQAVTLLCPEAQT